MAPATLARRHGRELASLAYLVLQNRVAAEQAAARGVADVLIRGQPPADDRALHVALVGATLRRALDAHRATREVDPLEGPRARHSLTPLSPLRRAVAAGDLAGIVATDLTAALGLGPGRASEELRAANRVAGGRDALRRLLEANRDGVPFWVAAGSVESAMSAAASPAPAVPIRRGWIALAASGAIVLVILAVLATRTSPLPLAAASHAPGGNAAVALPPLGGPLDGRPDGVRLPLDERLGLEDCDIQPASTELSFRGWLTLGDVSPAATGSPEAGTPIYALVTAGTAEWIGWQSTEGRPMYPRPVGRLACAVNPIDATGTVFAVSDAWRPPDMAADGCPSSPISLDGGDRQVGGPSAFVLLPWAGRSWWSDDPSLRIRVRIAPTPRADARISASARPLDGRASLALEVESPEISPERPPTSSHYLWLRDVRFPTDGCWLVSVSVDGAPVGAAILPVTKRPG
jgi:hypothetical protein